jgi:protein-S-isoprenylcysteine O-methyltransferase Ste14
MIYHEVIFVVILYLLYFTLWKVKKVNLKRTFGIDPDVMGKSTSNVQKYMGQLTGFIAIYATVIIILHSVNFQFASMFSRFMPLETFYFNIIGFVLGLAGLSFCLYAQIKMSNSWRVGIDENIKTELVTTGLYRYVRNPTYLGLFILNFGIWIIWPTWTIFLLNVFFLMFLEIQVRCEEDFYLRYMEKNILNIRKRQKDTYLFYIKVVIETVIN